MSFVRSAALRGVRSVIDDLGGDASALARRAGLPERALDDDGMIVDEVALSETLELAAHELNCPDLGLRVALRQDLSMLGPLAVAVQNADTAAGALEIASKYLFFHAHSLAIQMVDDPRGARGVVGVRYGFRDGVSLLPKRVWDLGLLFVHRSIVHMLGQDYGLVSVEIPYYFPELQPRYEELFAAPVNQQARAAVLRVPEELPRRPITGGNDLIRELAVGYLDAQVTSPASAFTDRTRALIHQTMGISPPRIGAIAAMMSVSPRSLQRHLAAEGTTFGTLLDDVREKEAALLLTTTGLPQSHIASAIALDDATTLSQYARRWWGMTARELRRAGTPSAGPR